MSRKLLILWTILILLITVNLGFSQSITVTFGDGRAEKHLAIELIDNLDYIRLNDIAVMLRATKLWYPDTKKVVLKFDGHQIKFSLDNSLLVVDNANLAKLVYPVLFRNGSVYVPVEFLENVLSQIIPIQISGQDKENFHLSTTDINVTDIEFYDTPGKSTAIVKLSEDLPFEVDISQKSHLILTIYGGKLDAGDISTDQLNGLIPSVSAYQTTKAAQISFVLDPAAGRTFAEKREEPAGIAITVEKKSESRLSADKNNYNEMNNKFDVIVIDPGHGGKDPGAVGPNGLFEKDITLAIAKKLKDILEANLDVKVILTRYDDKFIGLLRRTEIANNAQADLFVSIHCNASPSRNARGSETYFLALAKNNEARAVEAMENKVIEFEMPESGAPSSSILELILWDMAQNEFHLESSQLAEKVQDGLRKNLGIRSRGINQAGFHVLKGAFMPAILVETAFISNRTEERLLKSDAFQEEIAQGIYQGLKAFMEMYEK